MASVVQIPDGINGFTVSGTILNCLEIFSDSVFSITSVDAWADAASPQVLAIQVPGAANDALRLRGSADDVLLEWEAHWTGLIVCRSPGFISANNAIIGLALPVTFSLNGFWSVQDLP